MTTAAKTDDRPGLNRARAALKTREASAAGALSNLQGFRAGTLRALSRAMVNLQHLIGISEGEPGSYVDPALLRAAHRLREAYDGVHTSGGDLDVLEAALEEVPASP